MTDFLDITAALDDNLNNMAGLPPVAWENQDYEPVVGTLYLRASHLPAGTEAATISDTGTDEHTGVYQVSVFAPVADGKNEAYVMADNVADQFKRDTTLTYNSKNVVIRNVYLSPAITETAWYHLPVNIEYYAFTAKR